MIWHGRMRSMKSIFLRSRHSAGHRQAHTTMNFSIIPAMQRHPTIINTTLATGPRVCILMSTARLLDTPGSLRRTTCSMAVCNTITTAPAFRTRNLRGDSVHPIIDNLVVMKRMTEFRTCPRAISRTRKLTKLKRRAVLITDLRKLATVATRRNEGVAAGRKQAKPQNLLVLPSHHYTPPLPVPPLKAKSAEVAGALLKVLPLASPLRRSTQRWRSASRSRSLSVSMRSVSSSKSSMCLSLLQGCCGC
jgi:hypothetical protein